MARSHGRILTTILTDPDFRTLSEAAQRLYLILLAQQDLNTAGMLSINYRRWSRVCSATSPEHVQRLAHELDDRRYVLLDEETEEAFIRSLIRNDGIAKQPQMLKNALRVAEQVESLRLRAELAVELRRLDREDARATADAIDPGDLPPPPSRGPNGVNGHSPIQADGRLPADSTRPARSHVKACAQVGGEGVGVGEAPHLGNNSSFLSSSAIADATPEAEPLRDDVEQLVGRLCDRLRENDVKIPAGLVAWRKQARLLLDRDKRDLTQALRLIDWATGHHFWTSNIHSMPKFRDKYDQLLAQARQDQRRPATQAPRRTTDDKRAAIPGLVAEVMGTSALRPDLRSIAGGGQS